ncbi:biotin/lipoyl-containing protein [Thalassovita sp.]|uniref:biotin/lipoyl-containing protein n=1 Tax=Thalassovita sp. TaxID=1979401 RepID=UPI002B274264|nr:biotin/lipoyl-containing protein [Thalassovita sp.]
MPHEVIMPALGMAQDTGLLVSWNKGPGDAVAEGDVLFEVETDKSTMEVEAQASGYLTDVTAEAGADVPVGQVIARISDTPEGSGTAPAPKAAPEGGGAGTELPAGNSVIMPALGMAQDTGLIVAWHKGPGDAVAAGDILFEVETDKSTMEVEAGFDGFVAALLAEAGEEAPVGETIAVISEEAPANPVQRSRAGQSSSPAPAPVKKPEPKPAAVPPAQPKPTSAKVVSSEGRILASPKARRLALEQGLDLSRLVDAGHPQPYHVADLDVLKSLPATTPAEVQAAASRRLVAEIPTDGFAEFADWAADTAGLKDTGALLAGLAAASLGSSMVVAVESFGASRSYSANGTLSSTESSDEPAQLSVRDLRFSRISSVQMGAEDMPVLTIARHSGGLAVTLECGTDQLDATQAVTLLSNFAGRLEQPLRHLL